MTTKVRSSVRYIKMMQPYYLIMDKLEDRIRNYYKAVEEGRFLEAYKWIDLGAKVPPLGLTPNDYVKAMEMTIEVYGLISIDEIFMEVHLQEKNALYGGRDYAIGTLTWTDYTGRMRTFKEKWVKGPLWLNRNMTPMLG